MRHILLAFCLVCSSLHATRRYINYDKMDFDYLYRHLSEDEKRLQRANIVTDQKMGQYFERSFAHPRVENITYGIRLFDKKKTRWGFQFLSHERLSEKEAKELAIEVFNIIMDHLHSDQDYIIMLTKSVDATEIPREKIGLRIVFWDENYDRIYPPHVGQVEIYQNSIYISYANPETEEIMESTRIGSLEDL